MEFVSEIDRHNFKQHLIEGTLYISTASFLSPQTMFPVLVKRLGGGDLALGSIPVIVYLAYFIPQLFSANYFAKARYRKPFVLRGGLVQRMHIFMLALTIGFLGVAHPSLALAFVFCLYAMSQVLSGSVSPLWTEFIAKTNSPANFGKLLGLRNSLGAAIGIINGFILTLLLGSLSFPWSYVCVFLLAFLLQMGSLTAQRSISEGKESVTMHPVPVSELIKKTVKIVRNNSTFRMFLCSSAFLTLSFTSFAFFTVSAMQKYSLNDSFVGVFTVITVFGQIMSGAVLGWLSDSKGSRISLMVSGGSLVLATVLFLWNPSFIFICFAFFLMGVNLGPETMLRYNYAVDSAPLDERALYIGIMNAWLAPFYLMNIAAGWLSTFYGYQAVFAASLFSGCIGLFLLWNTKDPRLRQLSLQR
ncbi:MAG: MFS transporter [Bacteroidota bacterium]